MAIEFKDQTVLITGASSGIGEEFSKQVAAKGANLILVARSEEKLEKLASYLKSKYGVKALVCLKDLSNPNAPDEIYDFVASRGLLVDHLINNAGFARSNDFLKEGARVKDQDLIQVNVQSVVALTQLFLPQMIERKKGGVLNVASTASFQPIPFLATYAASKAFVLSFTEALWVECFGKGVRIFCLCPGNTATDFHEKAGAMRSFLPATVEELVRYGLHVYQRGKRQTSVYGWVNRILSQGYRISPRFFTPIVCKAIFKS